MNASSNIFFLDTNIIIYTFDNSAPQKQEVAKQLIELALQGKGRISYQVIQEFLNIATRKFTPAMTEIQAQHYLETVLLPLCEYYPVGGFYKQGLSIQQRWQYSWYDSLIIAAALETGCASIFSEDLQNGQVIDTLTIVNPFILQP